MYNEAYYYLKNKYGSQRMHLTSSFQDKLRNKNKAERQQLISEATDRDYEIRLNEVTEDEDKGILLLMEQYYYGIAPQQELEAKLLRMGIVKQ